MSAEHFDWWALEQVLQCAAAVFVGGLLASAALLKARERAAFRATVQVLDAALLGGATSDAVIIAEAGAGLLTLIPATRTVGLWLDVFLFAAFAWTFARLRLRGIRHAQCGCLGPSSSERPMSVARVIWMSCGLAVLCAGLAASPGPSAQLLPWTGIAGIGLGVLALCAVFVVEALRANTTASWEWTS